MAKVELGYGVASLAQQVAGGPGATGETAVKSVFNVITNALKNRDSIHMHGVGELRTEPEGEGKRIVFTPNPALKAAVEE